MIFTFLAAQGYKVGKSLVESDFISLAKELEEKAKQKGKYKFQGLILGCVT